MRIVFVLLLTLTFFANVDAKHRKVTQNHRRAHFVPAVIVKDYGIGKFNLEKSLPDLLSFLSAEKLPARIGQGSVHNRFGYAHLNAMDVPVQPNSAKGRKFIAFLKQKMIPFISISGAKKGVSTGPHVHVGFSSPHSDKPYPVGMVDGTFNNRHCPVYKGFNGLICF